MCHETGFEKSCRDMVINCNCAKWVKLQMKHPQTEAQIDEWKCADSWGPLLQVALIQSIENRMIGLQAATESFRNETVKANQQACQVIAATAMQRNGAVLIEDKR
jgi:hypothetical protein